MHPKIQAAKAALEAAKALLERAVDEAQAACDHPCVAAAGAYQGAVFHHQERRICLECGREEEAWSWPGICTGGLGDPDPASKPGVAWQPTQLNTEFVKVVANTWSLRPI